MAIVLLYNITDRQKLQKLRFVLFKLGLRSREVPPEGCAHPVGYLCALDGYSPAQDAAAGGFSDEMLVMCGLSDAQVNAFLSAARQAHATVALKAVLTQANAAWLSVQLHEELAKEHEAMKALRLKDAEKKNVHGKK